jgi:general secretion pathway protein G
MIVATRVPVRTARALRRAAFTLMEVLVVVAILVILAGVGSVVLFKYLDESKENIARLGISKIDEAVGMYKVGHNGNYPQSLRDLTVPESGHPAALEDKDLIDPWGNEFQYSPQQTHPQSGRPRIHTVAPNGNEIANW